MKTIQATARAIDRVVKPLGNLLAVISGIALILMMLIVTYDVGGRYLFNKSLIGAYELVQYAMVVAIFFAFTHCQFGKGHIAIDIITSRIKGRNRALIDVFALTVTLICLALITWGDAAQTVFIWQRREYSTILLIPRWPFQSATIFGMGIFCLAVLVDLLRAIAQFISGEEGESAFVSGQLVQ